MKEMISKIKIIGILSYTFYMIYSFMALWLFFEFIGHVSTHEFNILLSIKLFLMMGVTFTVGIVFNNIIENKKTNSLILSVAIIMGLVLNPNIVVTAYSITYNYVSSIIKSGNESTSTSCTSYGAKLFAVKRVESTIGSLMFLDLHKDNGDSWLFYGSAYSSRYQRDVTVWVLINCSNGNYDVENLEEDI